MKLEMCPRNPKPCIFIDSSIKYSLSKNDVLLSLNVVRRLGFRYWDKRSSQCLRSDEIASISRLTFSVLVFRC